MRLIDADALTSEIQKYANEPVKLRDRRWDARCTAIIADMIGTVKMMPTVGGWISVKDRLPEEKENPYTHDYQEVLCVLSTRFGTDVRVYKFGKGHFWNGPREIDRVISHWMPFPELPKEEESDKA